MYPNPQDALPLPSRPNVEQYRKLAKDLVKACESDDATAIHHWATHWIRTLTSLVDEDNARPSDADMTTRAGQIDQFAREKLRPAGASESRCRLADAQFVIARVHGFSSWPTFVAHLDGLAREASPVSSFELAADAVIKGDVSTLARLLQRQPGLVRARSSREHRATLLHYVAANGVENYRQVSPRNAAAIADTLLAAGAEVDAEADVYGGGCTALGLVATSTPPANAGVQVDVIDVLLRHGARMDHQGSAGNAHALVRGCLANGQPAAAAYLVSRGAPVDLPGAAGLGRLDLVKALLEADRELQPACPNRTMKDSFSLACGYGHPLVVRHLLQLGFKVDEELRGHGAGHTGLHVAAYHGHVEVVETLLRHGAAVQAIDKTWGTPPLIWALTGWQGRPAPDARYYDVVEHLVGAGATVTATLLEWDQVREDPKMMAALQSGAKHRMPGDS